MILKFTRFFLTLCSFIALSIGKSYGQTAYTFSASGATGNIGPTQTQCDAQYAGTNLAGNVTVTGGIQYWTVPTSGAYKIECFGGQGYGPFGGRGAHISGEFNLTAGTQLKIIVGQEAGHYLNYPATTYNHQFGGGGGSFVTDNTNNPLVIAGGGGGNHGTSYLTTCDGQITQSGAGGANGSILSAGGTGGNGGAAASSADGGGGLLTNGGGIAGGLSFLNGGAGGIDEGTGGFGCGGGTSSWNNYRGGGGGGYSGGGAGNNGSICCPAGGGGGSFNGGINPIEIAGVQLGDGSVIITSLQTFPNDAGISQFIGSTPPYCNGPQTIQVEVTNYGNNSIGNVDVAWTVNGTIQTTVNVNQTIDTNNSVSGNTLVVTLGTINVNGNTSICAWTVLPNSLTDPAPGNDTSCITMTPFFATAVAPFPMLPCNGDLAGLGQFSTNNAVGPVTHVWSNGSTGQNLTGVGAGNFYVVASNGSCVDTSNIITITEPPAIIATDQTNDITCFGANDGSSFVSATGGTPNYTVNWPGIGTGFSVGSLAPGNYNYTVTDANGCNVTNSITVIEPAELTVTSVISNVTTTNNGAIDITTAGGTPGFFYVWSNAATTEDLTGLLPGMYSVTVTDANGCTATLDNTVLDVVGLDEENLNLGLKVSPNPNAGQFTIDVINTNSKIDVEIFDLLGKKVYQAYQVNPKTNITLNERNGVYLVKIKSGNDVKVQKIILKK